MRVDSHSEGEYGHVVTVYRNYKRGPFIAEIGGKSRTIKVGKRRVMRLSEARQWARDKYLELRDEADGGATGRMMREAIDREDELDPTPPPPTPRALYFVQCELTSRIKIGISNNPTERLRMLQIGSPTRLRIVGAIEGASMSEPFHHRIFDDDRIHGEWFELSEDLLGYIETVRKQYKQEKTFAPVLIPDGGPKKGLDA